MEVSRDYANGTIKLTQQGYIGELLDQFDMTDCKPESTPMMTAMKLGPSQTAQDGKADLKEYQCLTGSLNWVALGT